MDKTRNRMNYVFASEEGSLRNIHHNINKSLGFCFVCKVASSRHRVKAKSFYVQINIFFSERSVKHKVFVHNHIEPAIFRPDSLQLLFGQEEKYHARHVARIV